MAVPAAPASPVSTPGDNQLSIAFAPVVATPAVTNYQYKIGASGSYKDFAAPPLVITGLANDKAYAISIRAVNTDGPGAVVVANGTPTDAVLTDNNGFADATVFANVGEPVGHLDFNDPDD
jgi:hypothetical protein